MLTPPEGIFSRHGDKYRYSLPSDYPPSPLRFFFFFYGAKCYVPACIPRCFMAQKHSLIFNDRWMMDGSVLSSNNAGNLSFFYRTKNYL
jgi:hypothetical protein